MDLLVVENASYNNLTHRRAVFFVDKTYFVIIDEAYGKGSGNIDLHFQLAPGKAVFNKGTFSMRTDFADGWNVLVQAVGQNDMTIEEEQGQVSFEYAKKEPRPAFRYRLSKLAEEPGVRFVTLVAPYTGAMPAFDIQIEGQPQIGAKRFALNVMTAGVSRQIGYDLPE